MAGTHPFAAVEIVWDRDTDTVYVSKTHRTEGSHTRSSRMLPCARGGKNFLGHGRETAGAKRWKAQALRLPNQYRDAGLRHAARARAIR